MFKSKMDVVRQQRLPFPGSSVADLRKSHYLSVLLSVTTLSTALCLRDLVHSGLLHHFDSSQLIASITIFQLSLHCYTMAARIRTALHELLPALRVPVVSAPMAGAAGGALAAEGAYKLFYIRYRADMCNISIKSRRTGLHRSRLPFSTTAQERARDRKATSTITRQTRNRCWFPRMATSVTRQITWKRRRNDQKQPESYRMH